MRLSCLVLVHLRLGQQGKTRGDWRLIPPESCGGAGPGGVAGQSLEPSAIGLMTNELVKEMRAESLTVPDGMFEGIAAVLAVLATMDDLL